MVDDGSAATAMLGLPGFVLIAVSELDEEIEQAIQTTDDMGLPGSRDRRCPARGRPVRLRDLPAAGRAVTLIWVKRLWRCPHPQCEVVTWSERPDNHARTRRADGWRDRRPLSAVNAARRHGSPRHD